MPSKARLDNPQSISMPVYTVSTSACWLRWWRWTNAVVLLAHGIRRTDTRLAGATAACGASVCLCTTIVDVAEAAEGAPGVAVVTDHAALPRTQGAAASIKILTKSFGAKDAKTAKTAKSCTRLILAREGGIVRIIVHNHPSLAARRTGWRSQIGGSGRSVNWKIYWGWTPLQVRLKNQFFSAL